MPILNVEQKTIIRFGTGDISISRVNIDGSRKPIGLQLSTLKEGFEVGEQIELNTDVEKEEEKNIVFFHFDKLESLDLLISQFKLLRGSLADGEIFSGQTVMIKREDGTSTEGAFVRLFGGDLENCNVKVQGNLVRLPYSSFQFVDSKVQEYFNKFYGIR